MCKHCTGNLNAGPDQDQRIEVTCTSGSEEVVVQGSRSGGFTLRKVFYTVPSRFIGHLLRVRLEDERFDLFIGGRHLMVYKRGRADATGKHDHVLDCRHVIHRCAKC